MASQTKIEKQKKDKAAKRKEKNLNATQKERDAANRRRAQYNKTYRAKKKKKATQDNADKTQKEKQATKVNANKTKKEKQAAYQKKWYHKNKANKAKKTGNVKANVKAKLFHAIKWEDHKQILQKSESKITELIKENNKLKAVVKKMGKFFDNI